MTTKYLSIFTLIITCFNFSIDSGNCSSNNNMKNNSITRKFTNNNIEKNKKTDHEEETNDDFNYPEVDFNFISSGIDPRLDSIDEQIYEASFCDKNGKPINYFDEDRYNDLRIMYYGSEDTQTQQRNNINENNNYDSSLLNISEHDNEYNSDNEDGNNDQNSEHDSEYNSDNENGNNDQNSEHDSEYNNNNEDRNNDQNSNETNVNEEQKLFPDTLYEQYEDVVNNNKMYQY